MKTLVGIIICILAGKTRNCLHHNVAQFKVFYLHKLNGGSVSAHQKCDVGTRTGFSADFYSLNNRLKPYSDRSEQGLQVSCSGLTLASQRFPSLQLVTATHLLIDLFVTISEEAENDLTVSSEVTSSSCLFHPDNNNDNKKNKPKDIHFPDTFER